MPKISIVMGSISDFKKIEKHLSIFDDFSVSYDVVVASAHRTPELLKEYIKKWENENVEVIIAAAGKSAHLPGVVASHTLIPVIGVPIASDIFDGQDALYSIVMMPPGIPVATVGVDSIKNAILLALQILALKYGDVKKQLIEFRKIMKDKVIKDNQALQKKLNRE